MCTRRADHRQATECSCDEESVAVIEAMGFDGIKVASCSAKDWPLLEEVASVGKPTIISTGGLTTEDIDNLVSFFGHRGVHYALMHCVSMYPTPAERSRPRDGVAASSSSKPFTSAVPAFWMTKTGVPSTLSEAVNWMSS